jgi:hypothetical protein
LEPPSGYKTELVHPSAPSYLDAKHRNRSEESPLGSPMWPSAIPSRAPPFGPSSAPFLREVSSSCSVLLPRVFLSLNHTWNRVIVISGDGAAADIAVGVVFRLERRPAHPGSIWTVHFESNGPDLKISFRLYILLKRPCVFQLCNPQSKAYSSIAYYPFESVVWSQLSQKYVLSYLQLCHWVCFSHNLSVLTPIWPVQIALGSYLRALHVSRTVQ